MRNKKIIIGVIVIVILMSGVLLYTKKTVVEIDGGRWEYGRSLVMCYSAYDHPTKTHVARIILGDDQVTSGNVASGHVATAKKWFPVSACDYKYEIR